MLEKLIILYFYFQTKYFRKFKTKLELEKWQKKKVAKFLNKVCKLSPFYSSLYKNIHDFDNTNCIINKKIMLQNFDNLNTAKLKLNEVLSVGQKSEDNRDFSPKLNGYSVGLSSGTSGNRGVFVTSDYERAMWCGIMLAKILPWSIFKKTKIAFFLRANNNLYETVNSASLIFKFFDLKKDYKKNLQDLNTFQPDLLISPPTMLEIIAEAQEKKEISINPTKIISVADVLYEDKKNKIEGIFQQTIHQVYQATEGFIAHTCKYGNLHINEDIMYVKKKYLDKNRFVPVITDFVRKTQPIINYELNDILVEDTSPCPCGSQFTRLSKIEGRCDDILKFEDVIIFPDFIIRSILKVNQSIENFQIIQLDEKTIKVCLVPNIEEDLKNKIIIELIKLFTDMNVNVNIDVAIYTENKDLSLKRKRVICLLEDN